MKISKIFTFLALLSLLLVFAAFPTVVAHAAGLQASPQAESPAGGFDGLLKGFESLTGVAMLIAVLINLLKRFGYVKDGQSAVWSTGLNLLGLAALYFAQVAGYTDLIPAFDAQAGELAPSLEVIILFVWQLFVSRKTNDMVLAGLPFIGHNFSGRTAGEKISVIEMG